MIYSKKPHKHEQEKADIINALFDINSALRNLGAGNITEITMPHHNKSAIHYLFINESSFYSYDLEKKTDYICGVKINYEL